MNSKMKYKGLAIIIILILTLTACRVDNNIIDPTPVVTPGSTTQISSPTPEVTPVQTAEPTPLIEQTIRISFTGDCMFGYQNEFDLSDLFPQVYERSKSLTYPFDNVLTYFQNDDLTIINYEGTLTEKTAYDEKPWRFRGKPEYAEILKASGVEIALLANNHAYDYLEAGYIDTVNAMKSKGVQPVGHNEVYKTNINGVEIVVIASSFVMVEDDSVIDERFMSVVPLIEQNKKANNIVIVNLHWGNETHTVPSAKQQEVAHLYIDTGADLIVGHHPHVLQGIEKYKDKYIVYSLGNFAFGGTRSALYPETMIFVQEWNVLGSSITGTEGYIVPCYITSTDELNYKGNLSNNFQPTPLTGERKQKCIDLIMNRSAKLPFGIERINILTTVN